METQRVNNDKNNNVLFCNKMDSPFKSETTTTTTTGAASVVASAAAATAVTAAAPIMTAPTPMQTPPPTRMAAVFPTAAAGGVSSNLLRTQRGTIRHERFNHFAWRFVFAQDPSEQRSDNPWQETAQVLENLSPQPSTLTRRSPFYKKAIEQEVLNAAPAGREPPTISLFYKSTRAFLTYLREAMETVQSAYDGNILPEESENKIYYSRVVDRYLMKEPYQDSGERHEYKIVIEVSSYAGHYNIFLKRYFRVHNDNAAAAAVDPVVDSQQGTENVVVGDGQNENDSRVMNGGAVTSDAAAAAWKPTKAYYLFNRYDNFEDINSFIVESMDRELAKSKSSYKKW